MPTASFNALASLSAERLVNCAVEGILLALIAWCLLRVLGRENAGTRFAVWMATLLSIAALPLAGGLVPRHNAAGSGAVVAALTLSDRWGLYLFIAWAIIATVMLAKLVVGVWQLRRLRAESAEVAIAALDPLPRQTVEEFQTHPAGEYPHLGCSIGANRDRLPPSGSAATRMDAVRTLASRPELGIAA